MQVLKEAIRIGDVETVKQFLSDENAAHILNTLTEDGESYLISAIRFDHPDVVEMLPVLDQS